MIVVISNPEPVANEASSINQLFDEGLSVLHLRKPEGTEHEITTLLQEIHPTHYSKIALHSCHHLANHFGIHRLHFNELNRKSLNEEAFSVLTKEGIVLSTSIHGVDEYNDISDAFEYAFLGPVFDSISKKDYKALEENKRSLTHRKKPVKLIALGGINPINCTTPFEWGFDGIAVLGALWNERNHMIRNFKTIQTLCSTVVQ